MVDTCQASTLANNLYSLNVLAIGSSSKGQNSYSHHQDTSIGVAVVDRFSYYTLEYFDNIKIDSDKTIKDLFSSYKDDLLLSTARWRRDLYNRSLDQVYLTEFFGSVKAVELTDKSTPLQRRKLTVPTPKVRVFPTIFYNPYKHVSYHPEKGPNFTPHPIYTISRFTFLIPFTFVICLIIILSTLMNKLEKKLQRNQKPTENTFSWDDKSQMWKEKVN
jgi:hypothetical protein